MSASVLNAIQKALRSRPHSASRVASVLESDAALFGLAEIGKTNSQTQRSTDHLHTECPLLSLYSPFKGLSVNDIQLLNPEIRLKNLITGRYSANMEGNDRYWLYFESSAQASEFLASNTHSMLNGLHASIKPMTRSSLISDLRFMIPPAVPDLTDVQCIVNYLKLEPIGQDKESSNYGAGSTNLSMSDSLVRSLTSISNRTTKLLQRNVTVENSSYLCKIAEELKLSKCTQNATVERDSCVLFRNVPHKVNKMKIERFFWDLEWKHGQGDNIRLCHTDKESLLSDYILIFRNRENALLCISRANNMPFLYNPAMPTVEAELL